MKKVGTLILLLTLVVCTAAPYSSVAQTAAELQAKIDAQSKSIKELEAEIAAYQSQLSTLSTQKNTLANTIKTIDLESKKLATDEKITESKIIRANTELETLGTSIKTTGEAIEDISVAIGKNIAHMNEEDSRTLADVILSSQTISDMWKNAYQDSLFRRELRARTTELATKKNVLISNQKTIEEVKDSLSALKSQLQDQKAINQKTRDQKNALLSSTKNQEAGYQKLVADKKAEQKQLEADLQNYESKLKFVLNPSTLPPAGTTPFIWPLDKPVITQRFGKTAASGRLYTSGTHNGVDFGVPTGTPVKAMAAGVVVDSGNADLSCPGASYGNWVFIRYDNGLSSVYGHLSLRKVTAGQRVSPGDIVAYSGKTGYATGPHLHVSVFANDGVKVSSFPSQSCPGKTITIPTAAANAYLDPMLYLPKS